jgi:hypothetical protein
MASIAEPFATPRLAARPAITPVQESRIVFTVMAGLLLGGLGVTLHALSRLAY